jgi:hypothetical protein
MMRKKLHGRRFQWRTCANCGERPVAGCLCFYCLRAAVVPLLLAALVGYVARHLP